jgi:hypothetical protein
VNGKSILLLDCEGFFGLGASENYDAKLFSITTLLSSYLIFNTIKIIDQASAEYIKYPFKKDLSRKPLKKIPIIFP